jgi:predicted ATPase
LTIASPSEIIPLILRAVTITKCNIRNYKSFRDSGSIVLSSGFNVIVGRNNAGKSAVSECLSTFFGGNPHRSIETAPIFGTALDPVSVVHISIEFDSGELWELGALFVNKPLRVAIPGLSGEQSRERVANTMSGSAVLTLTLRNGELADVISPELGRVKDTQSIEMVLDIERNIQISDTVPKSHAGPGDHLLWHIAESARKRIYYFSAERNVAASAEMGSSPILLRNASNLAQVINRLQSNVPRFKMLNEYVSEVLPDVSHIAAPSGDNNQTKVAVWPADSDTTREDLAIPLADCGTGVAQVIAMLYVLVTANTRQVIVIDEPQTFLHPGAIRTLLDILARYRQHQFIFTTHSPHAIMACSPSTILSAQKVESQSRVIAINQNETRDVEKLLLDLGVRLSDVFGADRILWVEGITEEACYPIIVETVCKIALGTTKILGVASTSEFEGRGAESVFDVYRRLTRAAPLLPPAVGFLFDRESRSERQREDAARASKGLVRFTEFRMFENYILDSHALASLLTEVDCERPEAFTFEDVSNWLDTHGSDDRSFEGTVYNRGTHSSEWQRFVDGALLLNDLFTSLTDGRVVYRKGSQGVVITEHILRRSPGDHALSQLANEISSALFPV